MEINRPFPVDIKCIWCKHEFTLPPKEIWYSAYFCPDCKREMGHFQVWTHTNDQRTWGTVSEYIFEIRYVYKGQLLWLIDTILNGKGYIHSISKYDRRYTLTVGLTEAVELSEGIEIHNPPIFRGQ